MFGACGAKDMLDTMLSVDWMAEELVDTTKALSMGCSMGGQLGRSSVWFALGVLAGDEATKPADYTSLPPKAVVPTTPIPLSIAQQNVCQKFFPTNKCTTGEYENFHSYSCGLTPCTRSDCCKPSAYYSGTTTTQPPPSDGFVDRSPVHTPPTADPSGATNGETGNAVAGASSSSRGGNGSVVVIVVIVLLIVALLLVGLGLWCYCKLKRPKDNPNTNTDTGMTPASPVNLTTLTAGTTRAAGGLNKGPQRPTYAPEISVSTAGATSVQGSNHTANNKSISGLQQTDDETETEHEQNHASISVSDYVPAEEVAISFDARCEHVFRLVDTDGSGSVEWNEFLILCTQGLQWTLTTAAQQWQHCDTNKDGVLDLGEFQAFGTMNPKVIDFLYEQNPAE